MLKCVDVGEGGGGMGRLKFSHKNLRNLPHSLYVYLVQTMRKIEHIFVAFSEKLSFKVMT